MTRVANLSLIHLLYLFIRHVNLKHLTYSDHVVPSVTSWVAWVFVSTAFSVGALSPTLKLTP